MRTLASFVWLGLFVACSGASPSPVRGAGDEGALSAEQIAALSVAAAGDTGPSPAAPIPLVLTEPGDGAVLPLLWPTFTISWTDGFAGNAYRVRALSADGAVLAEAFTSLRLLSFAEPAWAEVKRAVGAGGTLSIEVLAASLALDGTALRPAAAARATLRFSRDDEHPTGRLVYGFKRRPDGARVGPVHPNFRGVTLTEVRLDRPIASRLLSEVPGIEQLRNRGEGPRGGPGPGSGEGGQGEPGPGEPGLDDELDLDEANRGDDDSQHPVRNCLSCHTISPDGSIVAFSSQEDEVVPKGYVSSQGVLHFMAAKDQKILRIVPGGVFPRFHPTEPHTVAYSASSASFLMKQRVVITIADLHVLDLDSGVDKAVPGANDPDRCELFPDWSADGSRLVYTRSAKDQPCEGSRGRLELMTISATGGEPLRLLSPDEPGSDSQPRFSPNGRWVVFYRSDKGFFSRGSADLYIVPTTGGPSRRLEVSSLAMESWHAFSPDGQWLAFMSNRDRVDQPRLYITRLDLEGRASPAVRVPGASGPGVHVHTFDWVR